MPLTQVQNYDRLKKVAHIIAAAIIRIQSSKNIGKQGFQRNFFLTSLKKEALLEQVC